MVDFSSAKIKNVVNSEDRQTISKTESAQKAVLYLRNSKLDIIFRWITIILLLSPIIITLLFILLQNTSILSNPYEIYNFIEFEWVIIPVVIVINIFKFFGKGNIYYEPIISLENNGLYKYTISQKTNPKVYIYRVVGIFVSLLFSFLILSLISLMLIFFIGSSIFTADGFFASSSGEFIIFEVSILVIPSSLYLFSTDFADYIFLMKYNQK